MTVTVNKDILLHPDFSQDITEILCEYLNALIDEELLKEDADFDFIDECADAINSIRDGFIDAVIPVISRKDFMEKLGIKTARFSKAFAAVIAAVIMIITANTAIASATNYNVIQEVSKKIAEIFTQNEEPTEPPTTTTAPFVTKESSTTEATTTTTEKPPADETTKKLVISTGITVEFSSDFKKEYYVGERFNSDGMTVYLLYEDGFKIKLEPNAYRLRYSQSFGRKAGYETIYLWYAGFDYSFQVRILNKKVTPLLTSVYATFPSDYDFKAEDLKNIDLSFMKVYAVYSDKNEKELSSNEYSVNITDNSTLSEEKVIVTVTYETCSCSFTVFKE